MNCDSYSTELSHMIALRRSSLSLSGAVGRVTSGLSLNLLHSFPEQHPMHAGVKEKVSVPHRTAYFKQVNVTLSQIYLMLMHRYYN